MNTVVIREWYFHCNAWSPNIEVRKSRFLPIRQRELSWWGFEVKLCKRKKCRASIAQQYYSLTVNFVVVEQKAKNCQFGNHTFCFLNIEGSFKTNSCRSPGTIKNHWWTWSVLPITWFVKWLKNVTWFVNLRKFNPWFEIQTHPSSSVFNRSFYQINKDQFFWSCFELSEATSFFIRRREISRD